MDYFSQPTASNDQIQPVTPLGGAQPTNNAVRNPANAVRFQPPRNQSTNAPSVRLRRLPSASFLSNVLSQQPKEEVGDGQTGRRRSSSAPERPQFTVPPPRRGSAGAAAMLAAPMSPVREEGTIGVTPPADPNLAPPPANGGRPQAGSNASQRGVRNFFQRRRQQQQQENGPVNPQREYEQEVVDLFDVMDPEVGTLTTLNNIQNSLFIPYLGNRVNRTSTYNMSQMPGTWPREPRRPASAQRPPSAPVDDRQDSDKSSEEKDDSDSADQPRIRRSTTLTSVLTSTTEGPEHNYAVLPHGVRLEGWTEEEKDELNDYVRHLMHSRREGLKRSWRGFKQYVRTPLGAFVTVYSALLTFWGAAWVLFLIGWISVGGRKDYFVNIADSILVALFNLVGIGLSPFRAVDTYHMAYIAYYHRLALRLRKEKALPKLEDHNDLPETAPNVDLEKQPDDENVLTPEQQAILKHHQEKFAKSHTFYKPHETATHRAFSFKLLITAVTLLDAHSLFQYALAGITWGMNYKIRPIAATTAILCCSITVNVSAGIVITIGDHRTRKKQILEQMFRQELTQEALEKFEKKGRKSMNVERASTTLDRDGAANGGVQEGLNGNDKHGSAENGNEKPMPGMFVGE